MIGFVPVILWSLMFVVLTFLVSYASLKSAYGRVETGTEDLMLARFTLKAAFSETNFVATNPGIEEELEYVTAGVSTLGMSVYNDKSFYYRMQKTIQSLLLHVDERNGGEELKEALQRFFVAFKNYRAAIVSYNKLVKTRPSSYTARVFRFHSISA